MDSDKSCPLLGQLLLARGLITPEELRAALSRQSDSGDPLGKLLINMGALAPRQLARVLQSQAQLRGETERRQPLLLIVEEDPGQATALGDILAGADYRVSIAESEEQALWALSAPEEERPELVLLDLPVPRRGGIELLILLRKNGATSEIPVILLTGSPELESKIRERGLWISAFLSKPISSQRLLEAVEKSLAPPDRRA